jgi:hypothetical protein
MPMNQKGKCSSKQEPVAGGLNVSYTCTDPASSGNGQIRFNGDSAYTMTMHVTSTTRSARSKRRGIEWPLAQRHLPGQSDYWCRKLCDRVPYSGDRPDTGKMLRSART